jgi:hypothetical protein
LRRFPSRTDAEEEEQKMVSTVTSTTVTTVTLLGLTAVLGLAAVLMLISYLAARELLDASGHRRLRLLARRLNVAVVPLLVVFAVIAATKVAEVLN